jgi:hypothetical protein
MVIELYAADGQLQLSANETGWCDVALLASSIRYELGADATDAVTSKLSAALVDTLLGHSSIIKSGSASAAIEPDQLLRIVSNSRHLARSAPSRCSLPSSLPSSPWKYSARRSGTSAAYMEQ